MKKIVVDSYFIRENFTGVGRYLKNLIENLIPISRDSFYFYIILNQDIKLDINSDNYDRIILKGHNHYSLWQNIDLKKKLDKIDYDILWSSNYVLPLFAKDNSILTVHDVSWRALKDNYTLFNRAYRNFMTKQSLSRAEVVFTVSEFTKSELLKYYHYDQSKVFPIYHGIEDKFEKSSNERIKEFKKKYKINENDKLIGYIGSIFKRRNIDVLIRAFNELIKNSFDYKLFIVGKIYDLMVKDMIKGDNIIYLERMDEEEIVDFYSSLDLFVYISDYEGFGFPPLEALSCSTIPLILNQTSLKEVFENISINIEKSDSNDLLNKFIYFFNNKEEIEKRIFDKFSEMRREVFNWNKIASQYYKVLKKIYL